MIVAAQAPSEVQAASNSRILVPIAARNAVFGDFWSDMERQAIAEINRHRQANGCRATTLNRQLSVAATRHSNDMAAHDMLSHTGSDGSTTAARIRQAGYTPYKKIGETVAAGYPTPQAVVEGWMNSPAHRAILLDCQYQDIGIGLAINPNTKSGWHHFWTATFGLR
jgi:uncharacterized protein YkwD